MCGIAGFCNHIGDWKSDIEKMKFHMKDRGPDANGTWISDDGKVVFGHQRLSIMDLSESGAQPMVSHSGRFVICYNGEIYNAPEVKTKLLAEKKVDSFRGTCDTEILLESFESYGVEETLKMCKGMFAIALYDKKEKTLCLMRDRVGEKPLYYGFVRDMFVFASDIGCFTEIKGFNNAVNTQVLDIYFENGYIPAPYTIYKDIYKLEPGKVLTICAPYDYFDPVEAGKGGFSKYGYEIKTYWSMMHAAKKGQDNPFKGSFNEASAELERLLKESIKGQMVADVPVGAFLSAGIDSSTIVSLMQSIDSGKVKTFTIGMTEKGYNEADYAAEIAKHLGTEHTELIITEKDAKSVIPKIPKMFGEPFADSSQIPTYLVSSMTRDHVTVSLSGDGGDELFCGYTSYESISRIWGKMGKVPHSIRNLASKALLAGPASKKDIIRIKSTLLAAKTPADLHRIELNTDPLTDRIALDTSRILYRPHQIPRNFMKEVNHEVMLLDMMMYHPDDILVKVDRTAMAVSLESRVPMLDRDVVEFAWSLPIEYLRDEKVGKKVLRDVLYRYVPKEMMDRPKKGFSIPIEKWLHEKELEQWAESLIDRDKIKKQGYLNPDVVWRIWDDYKHRDMWRIQIWYILMFQAWLEEINNKKA
ncbi:MAG: asparagine synthase (glutamine-hydrolyzing) [Butyrivibrio sp.]|nr:asparagine synthase (glutamine-hydrolyzing) [Butyrivibrio sp.]